MCGKSKIRINPIIDTINAQVVIFLLPNLVKRKGRVSKDNTAKRDETEKSIPTFFGPILCSRNEEFIYAAKPKVKANIKLAV